MAHVLITSSSIFRLPSWSWSHLDFAWLQEIESQGFIIPLPTEVVPVASGSQRLAGYPLQVLLWWLKWSQQCGLVILGALLSTGTRPHISYVGLMGCPEQSQQAAAVLVSL